MPSAIDISSNALLLVGDNPINSFTDPGAGAQAAAALYPQVKQRLLAMHPWSFALKQQRLSLLSAQPDELSRYKYAFQVPTDLIRLWEIAPFQDYTIIGDLIYANQNTAMLATYIYDVADTAMPAQVVKTLEYMLAAEFAIAITEDENKNALYSRKAGEAFAQASTIDSQGRPQVAIKDNPFVDARFSGFTPNGFGSR